MADSLSHRAEALARYVAEVSRRVESPEVHGLGALLDLAGRVERALAGITHQEISWAAEQTEALLAELVALRTALARLADLKRTVADTSDRPA